MSKDDSEYLELHVKASAVMNILGRLPRHIELTITHNPNAGDYLTVAQWWEQAKSNELHDDDDWASASECATAIARNELWLIRWYPDTPVGSCCVLASSLEAALAATA